LQAHQKRPRTNNKQIVSKPRYCLGGQANYGLPI